MAQKFFRGKDPETFDASCRSETSSSIVRRNVELLNLLRLRNLAMTGDAMPKKKQINGVAIRDDVPWSEDLTDYDRHHFVTYVRLLDAVEDGASEEEICRVVLGIDSAKEPKRAKRAFESHLRRARWMTEHGYRHLLQ